jgi:contactin associated protein-like 2
LHLKTKAGHAWTAKSSDFEQQLIMDLGVVKNITRISTQGRPHSIEYVTEYSISYGYNGLDYADYKEPGGNTKVMKNDKCNEKSTRFRAIHIFVRL